MDADEMGRALDVAREIAEALVEPLVDAQARTLRIEKKGAIDLVTEHDLRTEHFIREQLHLALPHHRVVAEEEGESGGGGAVWYVDPIDGTTNFAHGHPFFAVSMGLVEGGVGQVGVVLAPALGKLYWGSRDAGAHVNSNPLRVSATRELPDALFATGFPYDRWTAKDDNLAEYRAVMKRAQGIRRCGAAALDLCLVAAGTYDGYWEQGLKPWDLAAGALLVELAGGRVTSYDGSDFELEAGCLVSTNGAVHETLIEVLGEARRGAGLPEVPARR
jgi:myo-inositol-1(or 4)-monophosphatase